MTKKETKAPNEFDYYRVFLELCGITDFREIVQKAVSDAKEGDPAARLFLAAYLIGSPRGTDERLSTLDISKRMQASSAELTNALYPEKGN